MIANPEIAGIALVWAMFAGWAYRSASPGLKVEGAWRHLEGALTVLALAMWGLLLGTEIWQQRWLSVGLVLLPHTAGLAWGMWKRRDGWAVGAAVLGAATCAVSGVGLRYVRTPSVPVGVYIAVKVDRDSALPIGQTVCLDPDAGAAPKVIREFISAKGGSLMVKRVLATGGAEVDYDGTSLLIDGEPAAHSGILIVARSGQPLPQLTFPRSVGEEQVWLGSDHSRGFDSRYFGAVDRSAIACVAEPLWLL